MKKLCSLFAFLLFAGLLIGQVNPVPVEAPPPPPPPPPPTGEYQEIFKVVEEMPRFPGCEDMEGSKQDKTTCSQTKLIEFVVANIQYPVEAKKAGVQGTCFVRFVVETDGTVSDVTLLRDIGGGCGEEAVRVVQLMNDMEERWRPGLQRGIKVRVQFNLPVKFAL